MRVKLAIGIAGIAVCLTGTTMSVKAHQAFAAEFAEKKPVPFTGILTPVR